MENIPLNCAAVNQPSTLVTKVWNSAAIGWKQLTAGVMTCGGDTSSKSILIT
jgi:hypothetical protein